MYGGKEKAGLGDSCGCFGADGSGLFHVLMVLIQMPVLLFFIKLCIYIVCTFPRVGNFYKGKGVQKAQLSETWMDNKGIYEDPQENLLSGSGIVGHLLPANLFYQLVTLIHAYCFVYIFAVRSSEPNLCCLPSKCAWPHGQHFLSWLDSCPHPTFVSFIFPLLLFPHLN